MIPISVVEERLKIDLPLFPRKWLLRNGLATTCIVAKGKREREREGVECSKNDSLCCVLWTSFLVEESYKCEMNPENKWRKDSLISFPSYLLFMLVLAFTGSWLIK